jgi:hypothetical protein
MGPRATITDDRGNPCEVIPLRALRWDERHSDPAFAAAVHRASRAVAVPPNTASIATFMVLMMIGFMVAFLAARTVSSVWFMGLLWVPLMVVGVQWLKHRASRPLAKRAADVLLTDAICPGCSYNLAGLPDSHGRTVCAECGGAWNTTRIARRHTFADKPAAARASPLRRAWEHLKTAELQGPTAITDDSGAERPISSPRLRPLILAADGDRRLRLRRARGEMLGHGRVKRWFGAIFFPVLFLFILSFRTLSGFQPEDFFMLAYFSCMAIYLPMVSLRGAAGVTPDHIREAMLRRHLCPSCAADLPEPGAGDDLCSCPECGAVWRVTPEPELAPQTAPPHSPTA